jgi:hypothetical protein
MYILQSLDIKNQDVFYQEDANGGDILGGKPVLVSYNNTRWQLLHPFQSSITIIVPLIPIQVSQKSGQTSGYC